MRVLVTGGAGLIGSAVVRHIIRDTDRTVANVDKLTYAGNLESLADARHQPRHTHYRVDICDRAVIGEVFLEFRPDAVLHLAAESHVGRSIDGAAPFIQINLVGTFTLLDAALAYWRTLDEPGRARFRFQHLSTDEVFGSLGPSGKFSESMPYQPNSPYAGSKAGSDHLVRAWHHTYGLPTLTTNCCNNHGPYHFPEKLIPLTIIRALGRQSLPVYGRGENVRDWLHVEDHAATLTLVLQKGEPGQTYNVGGNTERRNIDVVRAICGLLDEMLPDTTNRPHSRLIEFVIDCPRHDARYAIDAGKIGARARLAAPAHLRGGPARHRALVSRQQGLVGTRHLWRLSRRAARAEGLTLHGDRNLRGLQGRAARAHSCGTAGSTSHLHNGRPRRRLSAAAFL